MSSSVNSARRVLAGELHLPSRVLLAEIRQDGIRISVLKRQRVACIGVLTRHAAMT